jgi:hypothetical protein
MPVKIARSAPRASFGLPELLVASTPPVSLATRPERREYSRQFESHPGNPGLSAGGGRRFNLAAVPGEGMSRCIAQASLRLSCPLWGLHRSASKLLDEILRYVKPPRGCGSSWQSRLRARRRCTATLPLGTPSPWSPGGCGLPSRRCDALVSCCSYSDSMCR